MTWLQRSSFCHALGPTPADAIRDIEQLVDVGVSRFQIDFDVMTAAKQELRPAG